MADRTTDMSVVEYSGEVTPIMAAVSLCEAPL